jgi:hypothetical protein
MGGLLLTVFQAFSWARYYETLVMAQWRRRVPFAFLLPIGTDSQSMDSMQLHYLLRTFPYALRHKLVLLLGVSLFLAASHGFRWLTRCIVLSSSSSSSCWQLHLVCQLS